MKHTIKFISFLRKYLSNSGVRFLPMFISSLISLLSFNQAWSQTTITAGGPTTFCSGGTVVLSADTGTGLTYQWKKDGVDINGEVSSSYEATSTGNYECIVTNAGGSSTSNSIAVTVNQAPANQLTFQKAIGSGGNDGGHALIKTTDGGFAIAGTYDAFGSDSGSAYVVKLDSNGILQWTAALGQSSFDEAFSVVQTGDGGYVVTGRRGYWTFEMFVVKLDANGALLWKRVVDGGNFDKGHSIIETSDKGLLIGGRTYSNGVYNGLLLKLNSVGDFIWANQYSQFDEGIYSVIEISDGGYALSGIHVEPSNGMNIILVKTDNAGAVQWQQSIGGTGFDVGVPGSKMLVESADSGLVLAGTTNSFGAGGNDVYVIKFSNTGSLLWTRTVGGTGEEEGLSIIQTGDLGFMVAGATNSFGAGHYDAYLVKLDAAGVLQWTRTYGGSADEGANDLVQSANCGGIVFTGSTTSFGNGGSDVYIVETEDNGNGCSNSALAASTSGTGGALSVISSTESGSINVITDVPTLSISAGSIVTICSTACAFPVASITADGPITFCDGETVTLNANTGSGLSHQWKLNGSDISGAISSSYVASTAGNYTCVVTNACSSTTSNTIPVSVVAAPTNWSVYPGAFRVSIQYQTGPGTYYLEYGFSGFTPGTGASAGTGGTIIILDGSGDITVTGLQNASYDFYLRVNCSGTSFTPNSIKRTATPVVCPPTYVYGTLGSQLTNIFYSGRGFNDDWNGGSGCFNTSGLYGMEQRILFTPQVTGVYNVHITSFGNNLGNVLTYQQHQSCAFSGWQCAQQIFSDPGQTVKDYRTLTLIGGVTYDLILDGSDTSNFFGNAYTMIITNCFPIITQQPSNAFVCTSGNTSFNVTATGSSLTYQWKENGLNIINGGVYSGATTSTLSLTGVPANYDLKQYSCVISGDCSPSATTNSVTLSVGSATPAISITGPNSICSGANASYSAMPQNAGLSPSYQWKKNGLNVGTNSISYSTTSLVNGDMITCSLTTNDVCSQTTVASNQITVSVGASPPATIAAGGPTSFCPGGSVQINANPGAGLTYQWKLDGNTISGATSSFYVATLAGDYTCVVTNSCGSTPSNVITIVVNTLPSAQIKTNDSTTVCPGSAITMEEISGSGVAYQWKHDGTDISGATASDYVASAAGKYTCEVTNGCGSSTSSFIELFFQAPPLASIIAVTGTEFCAGGSVRLDADMSPGFAYQWQKDGVDITGETSPSFHATNGASYTCVVTDSCTSSTSNVIIVTVVQPTQAVITTNDPTTICNGNSAKLAANNGIGFSYQWQLNGVDIPGATLSEFDAASSGDYICMLEDSCGISVSNIITITLNTTPAAVISATGSTTICTGGAVTLNANTGAGLGYQWMLNGGTIAGATSSSYSAASAGSYTCEVSNDCGSTTSNSIAITVTTGPTASISAGGSTTFCSGGSVILNANTGTGLSYEWMLNGGTIGGATLSSYTAMAAGSYTCVVTNSCGSTTSNSIDVTINSAPSTPGSITGQTSGVCASAKTYSIGVVANATSYNWIVPTGATITGGQGTTSLNITFTGSFISGNISVTASNSCGTGSASLLSVTGAPAVPGTITGPTSVCKKQTNVQYTISAIAGASTYTWTVPPGSQVTSGQGTTNIRVKFGNNGGNITVKASNSCGTSAVRTLAIAITCREMISEETIFETVIYPNPTSETFTLNITSTSERKFILILRDLTGRELERRENISPDEPVTFGQYLANGIYFAEVLQGEQRKVLRVVKQ